MNCASKKEHTILAVDSKHDNWQESENKTAVDNNQELLNCVHAYFTYTAYIAATSNYTKSS